MNIKTKQRLHKIGRIALLVMAAATVLGIVTVLGLNAYVKAVGQAAIVTPENALLQKDIDCILVLGCQVRDDGTPSGMLGDRLAVGIDLYRRGVAPKILMSGDHGQTDYNEVGTMKAVAVQNGVPSEDVFMDHAGFSTYESIYRAKAVFQAKKIVIVTQEYHLYRALYIAKQFGLEAVGVPSDQHTYSGQWMRECREILARCKDVLTAAYKPNPTYLGEVIPVSGNGDLTND